VHLDSIKEPDKLLENTLLSKPAYKVLYLNKEKKRKRKNQRRRRNISHNPTTRQKKKREFSTCFF
jgi:hypothetical protein